LVEGLGIDYDQAEVLLKKHGSVKKALDAERK
jgi:N-acetylmuramic acid 6-phosphate etherase